VRKLVILLITLMAAFCLASCSAAPTLKEFKSEPGRFSVMTPALLEETAQPVETQGGKLDLHLFAGRWDDIGYFVSYCDYPPELAQPDRLEKMLDGARDGAVGSAQGRLVSEGRITLEGHPGRELVIETGAQAAPAARLQGHLFMVQNRLYQIMVVVPRAEKVPREAEQFLQSFKLLPKN
jgi:hypothetical protein